MNKTKKIWKKFIVNMKNMKFFGRNRKIHINFSVATENFVYLRQN